MHLQVISFNNINIYSNIINNDHKHVIFPSADSDFFLVRFVLRLLVIQSSSDLIRSTRVQIRPTRVQIGPTYEFRPDQHETSDQTDIRLSKRRLDFQRDD